MSREQIIRDTAYAIWEAEGKPSGRATQHWTQAEERVAASLTGAAKPPAMGKAIASKKTATAPAKPPAKAAAVEVAPAKTSATKTAAAKVAKPAAPKKKS